MTIDVLRDVSRTGQSALIAPAPALTGKGFAAYVVFSKGSAGGEVVLEAAHDPTYTGTWVIRATVRWQGPDTVRYVYIPEPHVALRVRLTKDVPSGSVSVFVLPV